MLTRIKTTISRAKIGTAWASSRIWAASTTGILWGLHFFKVPIAQVANGLGPGIIAGSTGLVTFFAELKSNYTESDPANFSIESEKETIKSSMQQIVHLLNRNNAKAISFAESLGLDSNEVAPLIHGNLATTDEALLRKVYSATQQTVLSTLRKYGISAFKGLSQVATHLCEPILLNVFGEIDFTYDFKSMPTTENLCLAVILLVAIASGMDAFLESKHAMEEPSIPVIADKLRLTFNAQTIEPATNRTHHDYIELSGRRMNGI